MDRACQNCAVPDGELVRIRRVYITPEKWDAPGSRQVLTETELWCISCLSQYPHELADTPAGTPPVRPG